MDITKFNSPRRYCCAVCKGQRDGSLRDSLNLCIGYSSSSESQVAPEGWLNLRHSNYWVCSENCAKQFNYAEHS